MAVLMALANVLFQIVTIPLAIIVEVTCGILFSARLVYRVCRKLHALWLDSDNLGSIQGP